MDYTKNRDGPPGPEMQTPARAATVAGENAVSVTLADRRKAYPIPAFRAIVHYSVDANLLVQALAFCEVLHGQ